MKPVYQRIAIALQAMEHCAKNDNQEWLLKHKETIDQLVRDRAPSGSGFDNGTRLDFERSTPDKLVFDTAFHHMDDDGCYDGWTYHDVIVTPDLASGFDLRITGRDRREIKDYIADIFSEFLNAQFVEG